MAVSKPANVLAGYVRQAGTQNKIREEREMWRLRRLELHRLELNSRVQEFLPSAVTRRVSLTRGRLFSDSIPEPERKVDIDRSSSHRKREMSPVASDYYWTRKLMKAEEEDPHRWGHSGYKEHHPDEFISSDEEETKKEHKKRRKKRIFNKKSSKNSKESDDDDDIKISRLKMRKKGKHKSKDDDKHKRKQRKNKITIDKFL